MTDKKDIKKIDLTEDDLDNVSGGVNGMINGIAFCVKCRHMIGNSPKYRVENGWMCESCKNEEDLKNTQTDAHI